MYEVSDDIDNFTCEICLQACPSDNEYISHTHLCKEVRKETFTKQGQHDINKTGIHVLYEKYVKPINEYNGLPANVINVKNIEKLLFRKIIDGKKAIEYRIILQRDVINSLRKAIKHIFTNDDKTEQPIIISYFAGNYLRLYQNGEWSNDEKGKRFQKEVIEQLIEQFKAAIKEVLQKFDDIATKGDYSKFDVIIEEEKLKKMIENRKIDYRVFNKILRVYNKALELMDTKTLADRVLHSIWSIFYVDIYSIRKAIIVRQKKSEEADASAKVKNV